MNIRKVAFFACALVISVIAATHRWTDSAHAIGVISQDGGKVRHAVHLAPGRNYYVLIVTASVMPPYTGDARIRIEGAEELKYDVHLAGPVNNFGMKNLPELEGDIVRGLYPGSRIALWFELRPSIEPAKEGVPECCSATHESSYFLTLRDVNSGNVLLKIPIVLSV